MRLSEHFSLEEFETSGTAERHGIANSVPAMLLPNLRRLVELMESIRTLLGDNPITITSGYRTAHVNRLVGSKASSHHTLAGAADFVCRRFGPPLAICRAIQPHVDDLGVGQLIHEYGRWVHVGILGVAPNNRIITIDSQGTRVGIHPARR